MGAVRHADCTLLVVSVRKPQLPHETKVDETQTFVQTRRAMLTLGICIQADPFASVLGHGNQFTKSAHVCCIRSSHTHKVEKCTYPAIRIFSTPTSGSNVSLSLLNTTVWRNLLTMDSRLLEVFDINWLYGQLNSRNNGWPLPPALNPSPS